MAGLPTVTVAGTLTADPDLKFLPNGTPVATFTIAANDRRYDPDTRQWVDQGATFLRCQIWRQAAENVAESLRRGVRVLVTGALKQRRYTDREGIDRTVVELDVDEIGPSLRWARATITTPRRDTATGGSSSGETGDASGPDAGAVNP